MNPGRGATAASTSVKSNGICPGSRSYSEAIRGMYPAWLHPVRSPPWYLKNELNPQLVTTTFTRGSKAARNSALCPPNECPITPIRPASTSGNPASTVTAVRWLTTPFIVALA